MVPSQDHKPVFGGDQVPNNGEMGAYSPVPHLEKWLPEIQKTIIDPTVKGLEQEDIDFLGNPLHWADDHKRWTQGSRVHRTFWRSRGPSDSAKTPE